jgi:hypothetical protein
MLTTSACLLQYIGSACAGRTCVVISITCCYIIFDFVKLSFGVLSLIEVCGKSIMSTNPFYCCAPLGWVGWTAQFCSCWRKNHIPGVWRQSRWTLESKEESLGDIASWSAHEWEARGMLQRHSTDHISWHLHGSIHRQWDDTVDKHQILVFREMQF